MNYGQDLIDSVFKLQNSDTLLRCFVTWVNLMRPDNFHQCLSNIIDTLIKSPLTLSIDETGVWLCDKSWMLISPHHMTASEIAIYQNLVFDENNFQHVSYDYALASMKGYKLPVELSMADRLDVVFIFIHHYILYKISKEKDDVKKFFALTVLKSRIYQLASSNVALMELCDDVDNTIEQCLLTIKDSW